jgi:leader peptidase (prepilin peptidase) / N-methyltransferase
VRASKSGVLYNMSMFALIIPVAIFVLGLLIGSFLNVVILRMNTGRSVSKGRSKCARCSKVLAWYELIPVLSYLSLKGKCRSCKLPISHQYPIVELLTGIAFIALYTKTILSAGFTTTSLIEFIFFATIASLLIVIVIYDLRHQIVPDQIVYPFIILSLISVAWKALTIPGYMLGTAVVEGVVVALPFFLLWFFSKGRMMGFGDVKLALGMGWLLGLSSGVAALFLAFWIGGIIGLFLLAATRTYKMRSQVPFAPFLIAGLIIAGGWGITLGTLFPLWP